MAAEFTGCAGADESKAGVLAAAMVVSELDHYIYVALSRIKRLSLGEGVACSSFRSCR